MLEPFFEKIVAKAFFPLSYSSPWANDGLCIGLITDNLTSCYSFLGYTNEVGEAFRALVPTKAVWFTYGVACAYVGCDAADKSFNVFNQVSDCCIHKDVYVKCMYIWTKVDGTVLSCTKVTLFFK